MQSRKSSEPGAAINDLASQIIGAAIEVHHSLRPGFLESVYEEALCLEFDLKGITYERQLKVVELKAVETLLPTHSVQFTSYLRATSSHLGLLINFNVLSLKDGVKRIVLS